MDRKQRLKHGKLCHELEDIIQELESVCYAKIMPIESSCVK